MGAAIGGFYGDHARAIEHVGVARVHLDERQVPTTDAQRRSRISGRSDP
jgi:hypothetical protein